MTASENLRAGSRFDSLFDGHHSSNESENHLGLDFYDIFGEEENNGTSLTGNTEGILGIEELFIIIGTSIDEIDIDSAGFNSTDDFDEEDTSGQVRVLEATNGRDVGVGGLYLSVSPVNDVRVLDFLARLADVLDKGDAVITHHLPQESKSEHLVTIGKILSGDTDQ